ncbi:MAG: hypothetical protein JSS96_15100 [Bacteroidetes bacterium]|nr:hypothetical protein [Bacteroidota bacterium]
MKKIILVITMLVAMTYTCKAQVIIGLTSRYPKTYKLKRAVATRDAANIKIMDADNNDILIEKGKRIKITGEQGNVYGVHPMGGNDTHISIEDFYESRRAVNVTAIGGAVTYPFKLRPQTGVIEPTFSLSGVAGLHFSLDKDTVKSLSLLVGVGSSSIMLKKSNSTDTTTDGTTKAAATFSVTLIGQWDNIQLAVSVGWDNNLDNSIDKWKYQSKPWVSVGVGFNIFSAGH